MSVKAMFYVASVTKHASAGDPTMTVVLLPVTRSVTTEPGTYESPNVQWSKYTPSGKIELTVTSAGAQSWYEERLGQDVPITFEDAPSITQE